MESFEELVEARKHWINEVLKPWCQKARRSDLIKAEAEWLDIAGKVMPEKTLWLWAWSRFPALVHESLGIEETSEVYVELRNGRSISGFPDARNSLRGQLIIYGRESQSEPLGEQGP